LTSLHDEIFEQARAEPEGSDHLILLERLELLWIGVAERVGQVHDSETRARLFDRFVVAGDHLGEARGKSPLLDEATADTGVMNLREPLHHRTRQRKTMPLFHFAKSLQHHGVTDVVQKAAEERLLVTHADQFGDLARIERRGQRMSEELADLTFPALPAKDARPDKRG
jgi:hypothetical protein